MQGFTTVGGVTKHSLLEDLTLDDHTQYYNTNRLKAESFFKSGLETVTSPRRTNTGTWGFDGTYIHCECPASADYDAYVAAVETLSIGATFEVDAKFDADEANANQLFGLAEWVDPKSNAIQFECLSGIEAVRSISAGSETSTFPTGRVWTTEHTFKIEWKSTSIKFYEDGTLLATHTTNIPTIDLRPYIEAYTGTVAAPTTPPKVSARNFSVS